MDLVSRLRTTAANNNVFATRGSDVNKRPLDQERRLQCEAIASLHHEAADEIEQLRALLAAYVADENRYNRGNGEAYGSISTETGMRARAAINN